MHWIVKYNTLGVLQVVKPWLLVVSFMGLSLLGLIENELGGSGRNLETRSSQLMFLLAGLWIFVPSVVLLVSERVRRWCFVSSGNLKDAMFSLVSLACFGLFFAVAMIVELLK